MTKHSNPLALSNLQRPYSKSIAATMNLRRPFAGRKAIVVRLELTEHQAQEIVRRVA